MYRQALKALRGTQPFNALATSLVRGWARTAGRPPPEWAVRHLHRRGRVVAPLPNGARLVLESLGDDWISNQIFWRGWTAEEGETVSLFFELAAEARVVADVGAHVGLFTLLAGHANPHAQLFAFEPMPTTFRRLQRHVELNGLRHATLIEAAVGREEATAEIYFTDPSLPCSTCLDPALLGAGLALQASPVRVTTLAAALGAAPLDLLKVDTEGTEPDVLAGLGSGLAQHLPTIIAEVLPDRGTGPTLMALLDPLGYSYWHLAAAGPRARADIVGDGECRNYLFAARPEVVAWVRSREVAQ